MLELNRLKNLDKNLNKKAKKQCFKSVFLKDMETNKEFLNAATQFFLNKSLHSDDNISIRYKIRIFNNKVELVELFNIYFMNAM